MGVTIGCGNAVIKKKDGSLIKGKIMRGDESSIVVLAYPHQGATFKDELAVARADIVDVDHPGNIHAIVAAPFALASLISQIAGLKIMADVGVEVWDGTKFFIPGVIVGGISMPIMIWGWVKWRHSVAAADFEAAASEQAPIRIRGIDLVLDIKHDARGIAIGFDF